MFKSSQDFRLVFITNISHGISRPTFYLAFLVIEYFMDRKVYVCFFLVLNNPVVSSHYLCTLKT